MTTRILMIALLCLAAGTALADVTNEVVVGFEGDGTTEVTDAAGNDITDEKKIGNSQLSGRYTHFFTPLKDDEKPIELRRFYQHPSSLSVGLAFFGRRCLGYLLRTLPHGQRCGADEHAEDERPEVFH